MSTVLSLTLSPRQLIYSDSGTPYKVVEQLGRGGNSSVYLCQATDGERKGLLFAAKLMTNVTREDRLARFKEEFDFLATIEHPSIMKVYEKGSVTIGSSTNRVEVPFYIAEYLPRTLADGLRAGLLMVDKVALAVQLLSGLSYLSNHNPSIVHRDIKPENIFLRGRAAVFGDFGLLKALSPNEMAPQFAIGDLSKGVRHPYMYPTPELIEYAKGNVNALTPKSDVFQLGLVLAEVFCGQTPMKTRSQPLDPVEIDNLQKFEASNSGIITAHISAMLQVDHNTRGTATTLLDRWEGTFSEVISDAQRLEGRAFW
jgi:serine/threonine protein kinase